MKGTHTAIPNTPTTEVIEVMIEAALANKHNVEAIYKAIVNYFENKTMTHHQGIDAAEIGTVGVTVGRDKITRASEVIIEVTVGPNREMARGYISVDMAMFLSKSLFEAAIEVAGM